MHCKTTAPQTLLLFCLRTLTNSSYPSQATETHTHTASVLVKCFMRTSLWVAPRSCSWFNVRDRAMKIQTTSRASSMPTGIVRKIRAVEVTSSTVPTLVITFSAVRLSR